MRKPSARRLAELLDEEIDAIYCRRCFGTIDILDIEKVYRAGREARAKGEDMEAAIVATFATLTGGA